ncbi:MAG TPA: folylpolyglutamate synthase/dihydrofolate synthase family protein [Gemmatimonadaceae bacterium]|nr:folylpolyglutamate synthase/dihydrofolate synthase family protein [Gemmatimonadaceae bacterium]
MDSGLTEYRAALDALFARTGSTSKFGLERTIGFLEAIGNPQSRFKSFHVAGTNGKGSVVATLYALLEAKGLRVGRYMSPHLVDFRERIVVHGEPISEEYVMGFLDRWEPHAESVGATFFEITTAMAFHYFAARDVDIAIIETGLGGRLDSTNVIQPIVAGITSIGLDHQEFLGNTEALIAREKAGIFKRGIPAVIGPLSAEARAAAFEVAQSKPVSDFFEAARLYRMRDVHVGTDGTTFTTDHAGETRTMRTGLTGAAQAGNTAVALAMLWAAGDPWTVSLEEASRILPNVRLPGRFQQIGKCILDVAHNPDGARSLVETIRGVHPAEPLNAVLGVLADKDWRGIISAIADSVERIILVAPPSAPASRAWNPVEAEAYARSQGIRAAFEPDFGRAVREACAGPGTTLITGSFHTVGDALVELGEKTL